MWNLANKLDSDIKKLVQELTETKFFYVMLFLCFFSLTFVLYGGYIKNDILPISGDGWLVVNQNYFESQCIKNGIIPLWNPYMNAGSPFATNLTYLFFYPIRVLFSFLPSKWAFFSFYSFHLAFGATGFSLYLKEAKCNKWVSIFMSVAYYFLICLGGYRKEHLTLIACSVYLPIVLYLIELYFNTDDAKFLYFSSLLLAFQFLIGFPQYAIYTDIISGIYLIVLGIFKKWNFIKLAKDAILWVLLYIGLTLIQLIPFAKLYLVYSGYGSAETSFEAFRSYSIHPIKLLLMLCPTLFSEHPNYALASFGNSGMQAELFLGTITFSLIILALWQFRWNYRIKLSIGFMSGILIYAINGEYDFLANIFYRIPVLGSFRCSSRIMFAFSFFALTLAAYALELVIKNEKFKELGVVILFEAFFLVILVTSELLSKGSLDIGIGEISAIAHRYDRTIFVLLISFWGIGVLKNSKNNKMLIGAMLCSGIIVFDTYPYWIESNARSVEVLGVDNDVEEFLVEHKDEGKAIYANAQPIDFDSPLSCNAGIALGIQGINSYISINDPRLSKLFTDKTILNPSFNSSGLYIGFPQIAKNLKEDNDLLSMLGIKYIIDMGDVVSTEDQFGGINKVLDNVINMEEVQVPSTNDIDVISYPIYIEDDQNYRVSFDCTEIGNDDKVLYFDFYGDQYDNPEQEAHVLLENGKEHYEYVINTGDVPDDISDTQLRLVYGNTESDINLRNVEVELVECEIIESPYELVLESDDTKVYENKNYREILYSPKEVCQIDSEMEIYGNNSEYDFDDISYVQGIESFEAGDTVISNVDFKVNRITADVNSSGRSFINFSQASNTDWKAYVDGKEVSVEEVNGYIQGIEIDNGTHHIEFAYKPVSLYLGAVLSFLVLLIWGFLVFFKKENR